MKKRSLTLFLLVLCFVAIFSGLCAGEDPQTLLTVEKITFTRDKNGREKIALFCNRSCVPELSSLEGENPRVVMELKEALLIPAKSRTVNTRGKLVKQVRSYSDKQTKTVKVVLDMEPSKYCVVRPLQDPSANKYMLTIYEAASLSEQNPQGNTGAEGSHLSQEQRIYVYRSDLGPGDLQEGLPGTAPGREKHGDVKAGKDLPSVDQGRAQLNAGEFAAAVDTFTRILAAHPQDSLGYRLRGNAYDNLGDRQKAMEDWTEAARLGDAVLLSYLDFLQVRWRGNSPE